MRGKNTTNMSAEQLTEWVVIQLGRNNFSSTDFGDGQFYDIDSFRSKLKNDDGFRPMVIDFFNKRKEAIIEEFTETGMIWKTAVEYLKSRYICSRQMITFREDLTKSVIARLPIYPDNLNEDIGVNGRPKCEKAVSEEINHMMKAGVIRFEGNKSSSQKVWLENGDLEAIKSLPKNGKVKIA